MRTLQQAAINLFGSEEAARQAARNQRAQLRRRYARLKHEAYELVAGPLDGHTVELTDPGTAPITVGGYTGRYVTANLLPEPRRAYATQVEQAWRDARRAHWYATARVLFWLDL
jgi:hypothetical protein